MDWFWALWKGLQQGARDNIVGGLVVAAVGIVTAIFWKSIVAAAKRLFNINSNAPQPLQPAHHELTIKVEPSQPPPPPNQETKTVSPLSTDRIVVPRIPRSPAVGFVARRDKDGRDIVERLKEELAPQKNQLVALWGEGGVGKTTLAAEAVREIYKVFANRLVWTSADGREDFTLSTLLDEVARHLGRDDLRRLALEPKKEEVSALIVVAPTLIVLDNFETISPDEQKRCVEWIANHAPCPALVTTRQKVIGARDIAIDAMSLTEAREFLKLLIDQARNPHAFEKLDRDQIIQASDANPLILQWVVAQIEEAMDPREVLEDVAQGEGDAAQRVFDRSFNLPQVGDDGRAALLALSLFAPSASRASLAEVAGFDDDLDRLNEAIRELAMLCLVETNEGGKRLIIKGLTRELAKARLSKNESGPDFRRRFVSCFLSYARAHSKTTPEDFDALELEKDNVLSAMDVAFEIEDWQNVMGIRAALEEFLDLRGYWNEAVRSGQKTLISARNLRSEGAIARFAHNLAVMHQNQGELDEACRLYDESLEIKKRLGDQSGIARTLHQLGKIAQIQGDLDEARRLYNESLEIAKRLDDQNGIASILHNLAAVAQDQGDLDEARRLYDESLEIKKRLRNQSGIASTLHELGVIAQSQGDLAEARKLYDESLKIEKRLGNQSGIAITLHNLAAIAQGQGDLDEAHRLYNKSLEIAKRLGDQSGIAITLHQLGSLADKEGNKAEAARLFREALSIFEKLGSPSAELARRLLERVEGKS